MAAAMAFACNHFTLSPHYSPLLPLPYKPCFPASLPSRLPRLNAASRRLSPIAASQTEPPDPRPTPDDLIRAGDHKRRRRSQFPPRLQKIATPLPESPNYYVWSAALILIYATRHAIANELIQWATIAAAAGLTFIHFTWGMLCAVVQYVIHLLRAPLAFVLIALGSAGLFARDVYAIIVNTTSVWPTLQALVLGTTVLSIGEATRSVAVSGQPWSFALVTFLAVGVVFEVFPHTVFVSLLLLSMIYAVLVQKKDAVSALLPVTTILVAIAEPSLKAVAFASFLGLSVYTNWKNPEEQVELVDNKKATLQPTIMVIAAFAMGLTVASQYLSAVQLLWLAKPF